MDRKLRGGGCQFEVMNLIQTGEPLEHLKGPSDGIAAFWQKRGLEKLVCSLVYYVRG